MPDPQLELTILGSGTAVPDPDRFPSGVAVRFDETLILVDLGPGTLRRLAQAGYTTHDISAVVFTHYHTDHTADLAALLFALRNPALAQRGPLALYGSPGLVALRDNLTAAWPWLQPKGYELHTTEIHPGPLQIGSLQLEAVPVLHTDASLAYRISAPNGASVALSGDADVCPGLAEVARDTDLFVCEAAFPDGEYVAGHLTPSLAGAAAQAAGTAKLCLTHFYPECEGHDLVAQAAATFDGEIVLATDLMRFAF